jgi:hypothetical protein
MEERKWLACKDPSKMLAHLGVGEHWGYLKHSPGVLVPSRKKSKLDRKLRLFACACCRRIWSLIADEDGRKAVDVAEQFADGKATGKLLRLANQAAVRCSLEDEEINSLEEYLADRALLAVLNASGQPFNPLYAAECAAETTEKESAEKEAQCILLRDVVGNPFRATPLKKAAWGRTVAAIASAIYEERTFSELPILADALEDAGCDNADILDHLRGPGPHVPGCWALDLIRGAK